MHDCFEPCFDWVEYCFEVVVVLKALDVLIKILWAGSSNAEGVDFGLFEAEEIVEANRVEGGAGFDQLGRRLEELASLVSGTDDKDAHVLLCGCFDRWPVRLVDEIPMQIHVVEFAGVDGVDDCLTGAVGGEADMSDASILLPATHDFKAAAFTDYTFEVSAVIDAVETKEVEVVRFEFLQRLFKCVLEVLRVFLGVDFGLQDILVARVLTQCKSEPALRIHVPAGSLDMIDAQFKAAVQGGTNGIVLVAGEIIGCEVRVPTSRQAHPSKAENG